MLFKSPTTDAERADTAEACVIKLAVRLPALLDGIDNHVERLYSGWPDRLYLVGTDGKIRYKSAPGPFGFSTDELEAALQQLPSRSKG